MQVRWRLVLRGVAAVLCVAVLGLAPIPPSAGAAELYQPDSAAGSVYRLYRAYFLREPDRDGFAYWMYVHGEGYPIANISDDFARSAEFQSRYGNLDNRAFLDRVYANVLGRTPDQGGYAYWLDHMNRGMPRGFVMVHFSDSAEFRAKTADGVPPGYQVAKLTLRRTSAPSTAGVWAAGITCPPPKDPDGSLVEVHAWAGHSRPSTVGRQRTYDPNMEDPPEVVSMLVPVGQHPAGTTLPVNFECREIKGMDWLNGSTGTLTKSFEPLSITITTDGPPTFAMSKRTVRRGESFTIDGGQGCGAWTATQRVGIQMAGQEVNNNVTLAPAAPVGSDGRWSAVVTVPADTRPGTYSVSALCQAFTANGEPASALSYLTFDTGTETLTVVE